MSKDKTYHHTGDPETSGTYYVWELVSGYSFEADWDNDTKKWTLLDKFNDPVYEPIVSIWCEL